jgi:hypothetical protein
MGFLTQNRDFVAVNNRFIFYILHFASFVLAVYLIPYMQPLAAQYIPDAYSWSRLFATWLAAYILALIILPELLCMIYKAIMLNDESG